MNGNEMNMNELAGKEERRNESEFRMNEVWMIPEAFEWTILEG